MLLGLVTGNVLINDSRWFTSSPRAAAPSANAGKLVKQQAINNALNMAPPL